MKTKIKCTVCEEDGQDLGGGFGIKLCHKHHQEEIAKNKEQSEDDGSWLFGLGDSRR